MNYTDGNTAIEWEEIPFSYANLDKKFIFDNYTDERICMEDVFPGDSPDFYYYKGDVLLKGGLKFGQGNSHSYYIIDGNVKIDGSLIVQSWDYHKALYITGSLEAKNLFTESESFLIVGKETTIKNLIYHDLSHAGQNYFKGTVTAKDIITGMYSEVFYKSTVTGAHRKREELLEDYKDYYFKELLGLIEKDIKVFK